MTPAAFHRFLIRPSTAALLRAMVEDNRRIDAALAAAAQRDAASRDK